ncbi:hypothetical protein Tco_1517646 [Tanacetum coccineum]
MSSSSVTVSGSRIISCVIGDSLQLLGSVNSVKTFAILVVVEFVFKNYLTTGTDYISSPEWIRLWWILKTMVEEITVGLELQDKKELAIPGQTATGKEFSNPLMAGSLPKTITTSKTINSVKKIHAIVNGKAVVISESSVRSIILFNDEDVQNLAPEGEGSAIHPEPQPTPSTSQPNVSEPQIASLHIETSLTVRTCCLSQDHAHTRTTEDGERDVVDINRPRRVDQLNAKAEAIQIILKGIDNDIYSTVDACPNACEMWKAIERLHHSTKNRGKAIVNSSAPTYDPEPDMVTEDDEISKDKEIDKLMALISLSGMGMIIRGAVMSAGAADKCRYSGSAEVWDSVLQLQGIWACIKGMSETKTKQADWKDDIDDESEEQELEAHYMYMAQLQEVTPYPVDNSGTTVDNSGPIFDDEPMHKVQNNNDNYNVFAMENEHPEQPESSNDIYLAEQGDTNITIDSSDICYDRAQDDQDETDDLDQERDLLASLIQKLKCEIDDSKNRNKFLESSNKELVDKLKGEIEDFKTKNKSLESSNNHFKEANNELSKTNQLMFKDLKKFQAELDKYNDVNYASKVEIDCAKAKGDLMSYKIDFEKSSNAYTQKINDLNQTISDMKKELCAHQETISIMSQAKEAQIKLYKTREDKELDKVIALENKVKVLNDIVYKTGQSVQTMNMLNRNCKTSFAKPEFLKKAQRANPRLYDIGCYNDNLALMLAPDSDETIRLEKERRSKLSDLIRPFDYDQLNNLYDLFVPQREKSAEQHYFPKTSKMSHTSSNKEFSKESFRKQTTLLEKRMDESIPWDQKCKSSKELFKIKKSVDTIFDGVERCKQTIAKRTYFGNIDPFIQNTIEGNFGPQISRLNADLEKFHLCLNEEMVADLRYFNSLEHEVDTLKSQLETQKTQFLNEIDRLSREYYYADHMNAILGVYTDLDEFTNLQCDYVETWEKCEHLEKELSKSRTMSKSFEALQKHAINLELDLQQCKEKIKNDKSFKENQSNVFLKEHE